MGRQPEQMMHRLATLVLVVLVGTACGEGTDEPAAPAEAMATTASDTPTSATPPGGAATSPGCDALHEPGEYEGAGHFDDTEQPYWIVVPAGYAGMAPAPLYIHLASGTGDHNAVLEHWRPYLDDVPGLTVIVNTASGRGQADAVASLVDQIKDEYYVLDGNHRVCSLLLRRLQEDPVDAVPLPLYVALSARPQWQWPESEADSA